jgi:hypothetical protein
MTEGKKKNSQKRIARIAGVLYLLVIGVKTVKPDARRPASVTLAATD